MCSTLCPRSTRWIHEIGLILGLIICTHISFGQIGLSCHPCEVEVRLLVEANLGLQNVQNEIDKKLEAVKNAEKDLNEALIEATATNALLLLACRNVLKWRECAAAVILAAAATAKLLYYNSILDGLGQDLGELTQKLDAARNKVNLVTQLKQQCESRNPKPTDCIECVQGKILAKSAGSAIPGDDCSECDGNGSARMKKGKVKCGNNICKDAISPRYIVTITIQDCNENISIRTYETDNPPTEAEIEQLKNSYGQCGGSYNITILDKVCGR